MYSESTDESVPASNTENTSITVDKEVVKVALKELLEEIPSFRSFMRSSSNTGPSTSDQPKEAGDQEASNTGESLGGEVPPGAVQELELRSFNSESRERAEEKSVEQEETSTPQPKESKKGDPMDGLPFILSEALPVVPAKLVKRILKGDYIDMAELLKDNMEVERRRALAEGASPHTHFLNRPSRRDVPDLFSWLHCFSLFAAVVSARHPEKARELWAYQAIMIGEHRHCGGRGWQLYDSAFRQQIVALETADFSRINQSLYSTTFLAYGGKGNFCTSCMLSDHQPDECALHPNRAMPVVRMGQFPALNKFEESRWRSADTRRKRPRRGACYAWNDGKCTSPSCRFEHVCSGCYGDHRRSLCRARVMENAEDKK